MAQAAVRNERIDPAMPSSQRRRLPEIDWFRALAISYMGITHGEFHLQNPPPWAATLALGGIFFCYAGFLVSFGMAQAIIAQRQLLMQPEGRKRFLRQAFMILLGYYLIAFGGNYTLLIAQSHTQLLKTIVDMLLLLNIPKAGDFFLSFLLYLLVILAYPKIVERITTYPFLALLGAIGLNLFGNSLAPHAPKDISGWWKMLFGVSPSARTFPVFGYAPLFVFGLLLGNSYIRVANKQQWMGKAFLGGLCLALLGGLLCHHLGGFPSQLSPLPKLPYQIMAAGVTTAVFCLVGILRTYLPRIERTPIGSFLGFVGRHSFWIIVWQYLWIGVLLDMLNLPVQGNLFTALWLSFMVFIPPLSLYFSQQLNAWTARWEAGRCG